MRCTARRKRDCSGCVAPLEARQPPGTEEKVMHQSFWKLAPAFVILAGSSVLGGCATRGYVDEQIAGVNQRIDSLDARVQSTESGVQAAQAAAQAASGQAQQVNQRVDQLNSRVDGIEQRMTQTQRQARN